MNSVVVGASTVLEVDGETMVVQEETEQMQTSEVNEETVILEAAANDASKKRSFQCEFCPLRLSNRQTYVKHLGRKHPERQLDVLCVSQKKAYTCEEYDCKTKFRNREELLHHLGKDHDWEIKEVTGTFETEGEFELFFQRVQKIYKTRFVSRHGKVNGVKRFYCNREGAIRLKYEDRTRRHIKRGSSKIGTFCTAHAIVTYHLNGRVSIIGSVTHYNHELEGKYLPLLESERIFIRAQAQMGMNCREILELLHKAVGELEEDDPLRYIDYKTIRNTLERNKNTSPVEISDAASLEMLQKVNDCPKDASKKNSDERSTTTLSDIVLEHTAASEGTFDIVQVDANSWGIKRPEGKVRHRVVRVADMCPQEEKNQTPCEHVCKLCNCCAHIYKCNCGGATKIGKMCKHIHSVVLYSKETTTQTIVTEEFTVAQEVEEEHGILDSYMETEGSGKDEQAVVQDGYPLQIEETERVLIVQQQEGGETVTEEGVLFQSYEMIPEDQTRPNEPRINPEFLHFMEQSTNLLNQLHQVTTPENILQACTIFQQLKMLVIATDTPKIVKG